MLAVESFERPINLLSLRALQLIVKSNHVWALVNLFGLSIAKKILKIRCS